MQNYNNTDEDKDEEIRLQEDVQNEKIVEEIVNAYKRIGKTENILSAMLLVTESVKNNLKNQKDFLLKDSRNKDVEMSLFKSEYDLLEKIESLIYLTVQNYYHRGALVRDNLSNMFFYIKSLKLKNLISDNNFLSLETAYKSIIEAYETIYKKEEFAPVEEMLVKDIELGLDNKLYGTKIGTENSFDMYMSENKKDKKINYQTSYQKDTQKKDSDRKDLYKKDTASEEIKRQNSSAEEKTEYKRDTVINFSNLKNNFEIKSDENNNKYSNKYLEVSKRQNNRKGEILKTLSFEEAVTIKDISEKVLGCSEKTIQRELNTLLDDGLIKRIGEKRWSKYILK